MVALFVVHDDDGALPDVASIMFNDDIVVALLAVVTTAVAIVNVTVIVIVLSYDKLSQLR